MKKYFLIFTLFLIAALNLNVKAGDLVYEQFNTVTSWFNTFPYSSGITWTQGTTYTCNGYNPVIYFSSSNAYISSNNISVPANNGITISFDSKKSSTYTGSPEVYYRLGGYSSFNTLNPTNNGWVKAGTVSTFSCGNQSITLQPGTVGGQIVSICIFGKYTSTTNWWAIDNFSVQSNPVYTGGTTSSDDPTAGKTGDLVSETFDYSWSYASNITNTNMGFNQDATFSCAKTGALYTTSSNKYLATKALTIPAGKYVVIKFNAKSTGSPSGGKVYYKEGNFADPGIYPPSAGWIEAGSILYGGCSWSNKITLPSSSVAGKTIRILIYTSYASYYDQWGIDDLNIYSFSDGTEGGTTAPVTLFTEPFSKIASYVNNIPNYNMTYSVAATYSCDSLGSYYSSNSFSYLATKSISVPAGKSALVTFKAKTGGSPIGTLYYKTGAYVSPSTNPVSAGWLNAGSIKFGGCSKSESFTIPASAVGGKSIQFLFYASYASATSWWAVDDIKVQAIDSSSQAVVGGSSGPGVSVPVVTGSLLEEPFNSITNFLESFPINNGSTWTQGSTYACSTGNGMVYFSSVNAYTATKDMQIPQGSGVKLSFKLNKSAGYNYTPEVYMRIGGYTTFNSTSPSVNGWIKIGSANVFSCGLNTFYISSSMVSSQKISFCLLFKNSSSTNWVGMDDFTVQTTTADVATPVTYTEAFSTNKWMPDANGAQMTYHTNSAATNAIVSLMSGGNSSSGYYASLTTGPDGKGFTNIVTTEINTLLYQKGELRFGYKSMYPCGGPAGYTYDENYTMYSPAVYVRRGADTTKAWNKLPVNYYFANGTWKFASVDISAYKEKSLMFKFENGAFCTLGIDDIKVLDRDCSLSSKTCGAIAGPSVVGISGTNYTFSVPALSGAKYYKWYVRQGGLLYDVAPYIVSGQGTNTVTVNFGTSVTSYRVICIPYDESPLVNNDACYAQAVYKNVGVATCVPPTIITNPADVSNCPGQNVTFSINAVEGSSYIWQENSGAGFVKINNGGIYSGATNANLNLNGVTLAMSGYKYRCLVKGNCTDTTYSNAATLTVSSTMDFTQQPSSITKCVTDNVSFTVSANNVASYKWQLNTGSGYVNLADTGRYTGTSTSTLNISNITASMNGYKYKCLVTGNCVATTPSNEAVLTVGSKPAVNLGPDQSICLGTNLTLLANGGGTYSWSNNSTTASINVAPTSTTVYQVTVTGVAGGCTASDEIVVSIKSFPSANAGSDQTICYGKSAKLTANGGNTYKWSTGSSLQSITVYPYSTTTYKVTVNISVLCSAVSQVVVTVDNNYIRANAGPDKTVCSGVATTLTGSGGTSYSWSSGQKTASINITPNKTTIYTLTASKGACSASDMAIVLVSSAPKVDAGLNRYVCKGKSATLTASGATFYKWSTGSSLSYTTVSPYMTTVYTVTGTNYYGCTSTDNVSVYILTFCKDNNDGNSINQITFNGNENIDLSLYPNPGTGYYKCEINTPVNNKVSVRIMNILGVKIMEKILTPENG
ncbi:MAG: hypothetical protein Q8880_08300, partial [Bacteroidota bacterium]|nr:hypothetical protein [Bacteroidota bacterium]